MPKRIDPEPCRNCGTDQYVKHTSAGYYVECGGCKNRFPSRKRRAEAVKLSKVDT